MISLRTFLLVSFLLHQGVVAFARIDNSMGEKMMVQDQQRNIFGGSPITERSPKELTKGHRANEVTVDAAVAYQDGLMDGITLTLIFVSLTMLIGCVAFLIAIYYSKGYGHLKRVEKKISENLESVKVDERKRDEKNRSN